MADLNQMSDEELMNIAFGGMSNEELMKIAGTDQSEIKPSFLQQAGEVASGALAGITNFVDPRKVGQTIVDTTATGAIPVTDREAFKTTPLFETAGELAGGVGGLAVGSDPVGCGGKSPIEQLKPFRSTIEPLAMAEKVLV